MDLSLTHQTAYAELADRCAASAFASSFPEEGNFTPKEIKGRRYWYFQQLGNDAKRRQRYVGVETPELLTLIQSHREAKADHDERRKLVTLLVHMASLPAPDPATGDIIQGLAEAGVFRLRAVLVGTLAYQSYSAVLGSLLPDRAMRTGDLDIAQFREVSVAVEDSTPPMLDVLRKIDRTFRAIPYALNGRRTVAYATKTGYRVEFLTPNRGPETDEPQSLPALGTDAQPLRFLDFLIRDPIRAVVLYGGGILVNVPSPERYAVHKLIVARRRRKESDKVAKDIRQAAGLLGALAEKRRADLESAWAEMRGRGEKWRQLAREGWDMLPSRTKERVLASAFLKLD